MTIDIDLKFDDSTCLSFSEATPTLITSLTPTSTTTEG